MPSTPQTEIVGVFDEDAASFRSSLVLRIADPVVPPERQDIRAPLSHCALLSVVTAIRYVRRMRGGSEPHLLAADDGEHYVVKFLQNRQHPHVLTNELVAHTILDAVEIPAPTAATIRVAESLAAEAWRNCLPDSQRCGRAYEAGVHFGSRYVGRFGRSEPYEYLPLNLLLTVANLADFCGVLAFDKWVCNLDGRQALFRRAREAPGRAVQWRSWMIDHGFALGGPHWRFDDGTPEQGLYFRREIYGDVRGYESFEPWLSRIIDYPASALDKALRSVPPEWISGSTSELESALDRLYTRRALVPELLHAAKQSARDPFPNWSSNRSYCGLDFAGTA